MLSKKERLTKIIKYLNTDIHERDEEIKVLLLASLSGQNTFLLGPPGTAKSLLSRRLSTIFKSGAYYEYLMHRFSSPEDIFGPISISELKKDNYIRRVDGFLPTSDFVFLDEIWKSSPAILNTLLTIINEKKFRNGNSIENVPLKFLISASNEVPPDNHGLEALYDRFLIRLYVEPLKKKDNIQNLLQSRATKETTNLPEELLITNNEWETWKENINEVLISNETFKIIHKIRSDIEKIKDELNIYISDRRWQKAAFFLKASAFFCDRKETSIIDTLLLKHCLWTTEDNRNSIVKIIEEAVTECAFDIGIDLSDLEKEIDDDEKIIRNILFYLKDEYKSIYSIRGKDFFTCDVTYTIKENGKKVKESRELYIPVKMSEEKIDFNPENKNGKKFNDLKCKFNHNNACEIQLDMSKDPNIRNWQTITHFKPKINKKGERRDDIDPEKVEPLQYKTHNTMNKIEGLIEKIDDRLYKDQKSLDHPFISDKSVELVMDGVSNQKIRLKSYYKDCERLMKLIGTNNA